MRMITDTTTTDQNQQASDGANTSEHDKQNDGAWRGRAEAKDLEIKALKDQLSNAQWAQEKLAEQSKDTPLLDEETIKQFSESFGEDGMKVFVKAFEKVMSKLPKNSTVQQATDQAKKAQDEATKAVDSVALTEFLGSFDNETRARIQNPNSELMKFAATIKVGVGKTAKTEIEGIINSRDKSDDAQAYINDLKAQFAASKDKPQTAATGTAASNQPGTKNVPAVRNFTDSISSFKDIT
jgi:hypothetical protein